MARTYVINGKSFNFPETRDIDWGDAVTNWAGAVTTDMLSLAGGSFPITNEIDFGSTAGLRATYFSSKSDDPCQSGAVRLAKEDSINWISPNVLVDSPVFIFDVKTAGSIPNVIYYWTAELYTAESNLQPYITLGSIVTDTAGNDFEVIDINEFTVEKPFVTLGSATDVSPIEDTNYDSTINNTETSALILDVSDTEILRFNNIDLVDISSTQTLSNKRYEGTFSGVTALEAITADISNLNSNLVSGITGLFHNIGVSQLNATGIDSITINTGSIEGTTGIFNSLSVTNLSTPSFSTTGIQGYTGIFNHLHSDTQTSGEISSSVINGTGINGYTGLFNHLRSDIQTSGTLSASVINGTGITGYTGLFNHLRSNTQTSGTISSSVINATGINGYTGIFNHAHINSLSGITGAFTGLTSTNISTGNISHIGNLKGAHYNSEGTTGLSKWSIIPVNDGRFLIRSISDDDSAAYNPITIKKSTTNNNSQANVDFIDFQTTKYVNTGDLGTLYVDTVNNRVGVGLTGPSVKLEVSGGFKTDTITGTTGIFTGLHSNTQTSGTISASVINGTGINGYTGLFNQLRSDTQTSGTISASVINGTGINGYTGIFTGLRSVNSNTDVGVINTSLTIGNNATLAVATDNNVDLGVAGKRFKDGYFGGSVIVDGNFTVNGTTTFINSETLEVSDPTIRVNKNGTSATAEGAGLIIEGTSGIDIGKIAYDGSLASKFKCGVPASMKEIITTSDIQAITNKTNIQGNTGLFGVVGATGINAHIATAAIINATGINGWTGMYQALSSNLLAVNTTSDASTIYNKLSGTTWNYSRFQQAGTSKWALGVDATDNGRFFIGSYTPSFANALTINPTGVKGITSYVTFNGNTGLFTGGINSPNIIGTTISAPTINGTGINGYTGIFIQLRGNSLSSNSHLSASIGATGINAITFSGNTASITGIQGYTGLFTHLRSDIQTSGTISSSVINGTGINGYTGIFKQLRSDIQTSGTISSSVINGTGINGYTGIFIQLRGTSLSSNAITSATIGATGLNGITGLFNHIGCTGIRGVTGLFQSIGVTGLRGHIVSTHTLNAIQTNSTGLRGLTGICDYLNAGIMVNPTGLYIGSGVTGIKCSLYANISATNKPFIRYNTTEWVFSDAGSTGVGNEFAFNNLIPKVHSLTGATGLQMVEGTHLIQASTSAIAYTLTLPAALNNAALLEFKKTDTSFNTLTITRTGTNTIDSLVSRTISIPNGSIRLLSNRTDTWRVL